MAVLDELITRIGFKVDGLGNLTRAEGKLKKFRGELDKFRNAFKTGLSGTTALISSMSSLAARIALVTAAVGTLAAALIGPLVAGLTAVGVASAKARRELQITANSQGTNAQNLDVLSNFYNIFDVGIDKAREWAKETSKSIDEVVQSAKSGDAEARKKLTDAGIVAFDTGKKDKKGNPVFTSNPMRGKARDTSILGAEATHNMEAWRRQAEVAEGKGNYRQAQAFRKRAAAAAELTGLDKDAQTRIHESPVAPAQYPEELKKQTEKRPTRSDEQDERAKRIAEKWAKVSDNFGAIMEGAGFKLFLLGEMIADYVVPALLTFTDWLVKAAKMFGLIPETQEDADKRKAAAQKEDEEFKKDPAKRFEKIYGNAATSADPDHVKKLYGGGGSGGDPDHVKKLYGGGTAEGAQPSAFERLLKLLSPETQVQKAQASTDQKVAQTTYNNVGNDQRNVTNNFSTTVNATVQGMEQLGGIVGGAVRSNASSIIKQNNASTNSTPKP